MNGPVITIDGPSASGKSSVSRELARRLGWKWVSTGCFYRGLAFVALQEGLDICDEDALAELILSPDWKVEMGEEFTAVLYKGLDVTLNIHGEKAGAAASQISQFPKVRQGLLERQRKCSVIGQGLIAEGRDCGSVVFPNAKMKVFLTADPEKRALRRSSDEQTGVRETLKLQEKRDREDSQRKQAPMKVPEGAIVVDSSDMSIEDVAFSLEEKFNAL